MGATAGGGKVGVRCDLSHGFPSLPQVGYMPVTCVALPLGSTTPASPAALLIETLLHPESFWLPGPGV